MEEIEFVYAAGKRITSILIYTTSDKYLFTRKRDLNGVVHYDCYTKGCTKKVQIQNGICSRKIDSETHSHPDHETMYEGFRKEFLMKTRTQSNPDISIRDIVSDEIGDVAAESPDSPFRRLRSSLYSNRKKKIPFNPRTFAGTNFYITNDYVKSLLSDMSETASISHNIYTDEETVYIILAAKDILQNLPDCRQAIISASSRVVPPSNCAFKLLLTVSILKMKDAYPCIFVLMTDRKQSTYERIFNEVESKWNLRLTTAWVDYERSLRNVIRSIHPVIEIKAFWFQFCIAIRRKCKTLENFFENLWVNQRSSVLYHQFLCLPFLPQSEVPTAFQYLKLKSNGYEGFSAFIELFEKVWMRREGAANFVVDMDYFGDHCAINFNESLKKKWHSPGATHSLIDLFKLIKREMMDSIDRYTNNKSVKGFSSRQTNFIKKQVAKFVASEPKDISSFFAKLTFTDNNGSVKGLDNYTVGDENEFADDDDSAYDGMDLPDQAPQPPAEQQEPELASNETCVVCLVNMKTIMLEPCNHLKFCRDCVDQLMIPRLNADGSDIVPKCPICRRVITGSRVVYL